MTPLPKKKHARSRTKTRKAAISFKIPQLIRCSKCGTLRFPHRKCPNCGFYKEIKKPEVPKSEPEPSLSAKKLSETEKIELADEKK